MCRSIERGVFRASPRGAHFLILGGITMKKILAIFIFIACIFSICACGDNETPGENNNLGEEKDVYAL